MARVDGSQFLPLRSHAHWTLAVAQHRAGRLGEAAAAGDTARALARAKGDLALAESIGSFPPRDGG